MSVENMSWWELRDALEAELQAEVFMAALYTSTIRRLEAEVERLTEENRALRIGAGRRPL